MTSNGAGFSEQSFDDSSNAATTAKAGSDGDSGGGNSHDPNPNPWPQLAPVAYHGLAGEVVSALSPQTESDPIALLLQYLASFGNVVGRGPYYPVEASRHFANLFAVLVGETAKSRKGTAADRIRQIFEIIDPDWAQRRTPGGISSGEGVLWALRDPIYNMRRGVEELTDPGVDDKRLLLDEREFSAALEVMKREGNVVSRIVRDAWDCRPVIRTLTKQTPVKVTNAFVSIIGHITAYELQEKLDRTSMANGYANRFLFACIRRSKLLPHGGAPTDEAAYILGRKTASTIEAARSLEQIIMGRTARRLWEDVYPKLSEGRPGLLGAITGRAEAQTVRLALIYALLDGSKEIGQQHLEAALALWAYCDASARYIFGDLLGDKIADEILRALRIAGANGMTRRDLYDLFQRNRSAAEISKALALLLAAGKARFTRTQAKRGPWMTETWFAV